MAVRMAAWACIVGMVAALAGCGGGGGGAASAEDEAGQGRDTPSATAVFSISATPRSMPVPEDDAKYAARLREAADMAQSVGARGHVEARTWKELEPSAGNPDAHALSALQAAIAQAHDRGLAVFVSLQVVNTHRRELPTGIHTLAFDHPTLMSRLRLLLDRIVAPNVGRIRYLAIGNEVDAYLRSHPSEWTAYRSMLRDAIRHVRTLDPSIRIGVTATFDGATTQSRAELADLNQASDALMLTYYPLQFAADGAMRVRSPDGVAADFAAMAQAAGARPVVLQEVGFPASAGSGSSEALQAQFVTRLFAAWGSRPDQFAFLNYFLLHDFAPEVCASLARYYGAADAAELDTFLCSLGLLRSDGTPRSGWAVLQAEAANAKFLR